MGNQVFANNMEISCKAADGKSVACFPDVCFTPPQAPPTPVGVPIPYPNTGMAKDTTRGSRTVKITRKEVMLKNKSYFKTSYGDEAGCAPKKGIVTSKIKGKVYFNSWSMDVKFEGENVVRHLDLTTHNHASFPGNSPTWPFLDEAAFAGTGPCKGVASNLKKHCSKFAEPHLNKKGELGERKSKAALADMCNDTKCKEALQCVLQKHKSKKANNNCCDGKTTHHLVPSADFIPHSARGKKDPTTGYRDIGAPCICVEGDDHNEREPGSPQRLKEHGRIGRSFTLLRNKFISKFGADKYTLAAACDLGAQSAKAAIKKCPKGCIEKQLADGHKQMNLKSPSKPGEKMPRISEQKAPPLEKPSI
ncbi:PAAR-like domain-containing protein [Pseudomonas chlororaphis]